MEPMPQIFILSDFIENVNLYLLQFFKQILPIYDVCWTIIVFSKIEKGGSPCRLD